MKRLSAVFFLLLTSLCLPGSGFCGPDKRVHLIWQGGYDGWERDWIHELFSKSPYEIEDVVDGRYEVVLDDSVVVISSPDPYRYLKYFRSFRQGNYKFGVVHISDEGYHHPTDFYAFARFVLRNYWHKQFLSNGKVITFPLGYKQQFWNNRPNKEFKKASERKYTWSFAGQVTKSTRRSMYTNMLKIPNYHVHEIFEFWSPTSLSAEEYRDLLLESIFMPCPRGNWNLDTFRLSEALECGCIPIVDKTPLDYFAKLFGYYPFIAVSSWEEAPKIINQLLANPEQLDQLQQRCSSWWIEYKEKLKDRIADLVAETFR
jgi:hypothetical protein